MKRWCYQSLLLIVGCVLGACVTRADLEQIKTDQATIMEKLDKIEKLAANTGRAPQPPGPPPGPDPSKVYAFAINDSPIKGSNDAWVTVIEVSDFQCPFCARVGGALKEIETTYGNDVRLVFKHNPLPFHQRAMPAAMAAECSREQGKFWQMHDKLFESQQTLEDPDLTKMATDIKLDVAKYTKCMGENRHKSRIEQDVVTANRLGARGTPAFFINGRFLSGAQPFPSFKAIIDEELKKAKDSGISRKEYYAKVVEEKGQKAM